MARHRLRGILLTLAFVTLVAAETEAGGGGEESRDAAAYWPRWRGPQANGISSENRWVTGHLDKLSIAWKAEIGVGYSGVSVVGDRLYTMGCIDDRESVFCLDAAKGRQIWNYSYPDGPKQYPEPRVTPTVDGERVYALGQYGDLVCLDRLKGSLIWSRSLTRDFGAGTPTWGFAGSPVVWENLLLLNAGRSGMALNKESGELAWGTPGTGGYATVVVFSAQGKTLLAIFGERALYGVDPSSGAAAWSFPWVTANDVNAADPLAIGESLFITSDYGCGCALLAVSADGVHPVWRNTNVSSHFSSAVFLNDAIFANSGDANAHRGSFVCLDPVTGDVRWRVNQGVGSVLAAGDRLFLLNESGRLRVAEASRTEYREISTCVFPPGRYWNMPVLANGRLYVRNSEGYLYCVDLRP